MSPPREMPRHGKRGREIAAKTGKGYEQHGRRYRVKVLREDGKRGYVSFETEEEAAAFARQRVGTRGLQEILQQTGGPRRITRASRIALEAALSGGRETPTVAELGRELVADQTIRPNTRRTYRNSLTRVLQDEGFANTEVGEVTASDIRRFFNQLGANRENVRSLLAKTFNAAVDEGYITLSPLKQAKIRFPRRNGKLRPGDPRVLTADEVEALVRAAGNDRDALAIRLGAYVGLRAGEVGGLQVEDVEVKGCIVHVRRNSQRGGMGLPKTSTSERSLRVLCSLSEDIARYVSEHEPLADGTILYTSQRNPMTDQPLTKIVVEACERAGLRRITFHDLRHTCASLLIASKLEPKAIQSYLGHSTIGMTYDVYGGLFPNADAPLADAMQALRSAAERRALPATAE